MCCAAACNHCHNPLCHTIPPLSLSPSIFLSSLSLSLSPCIPLFNLSLSLSLSLSLVNFLATLIVMLSLFFCSSLFFLPALSVHPSLLLLLHLSLFPSFSLTVHMARLLNLHRVHTQWIALSGGVTNIRMVRRGSQGHKFLRLTWVLVEGGCCEGWGGSLAVRLGDRGACAEGVCGGGWQKSAPTSPFKSNQSLTEGTAGLKGKTYCHHWRERGREGERERERERAVRGSQVSVRV